jgi:hypothetical protein
MHSCERVRLLITYEWINRSSYVTWWEEYATANQANVIKICSSSDSTEQVSVAPTVFTRIHKAKGKVIPVLY